MEAIITVGLDLAKSVFQVHGIDARGSVLRRRLRRAEVLKFFAELPPCLIGMEACGSAHHWARELAKLGHNVKLMPPTYVKPYVKRGKTDAGDAEAIAEAVTRPTMRFVAAKTIDQQSVLMLHKVRDLLTRQRTQLINALRGHLREFGVVAPAGAGGVAAAIRLFREVEGGFPDLARAAVNALVSQLENVAVEIRKAEAAILRWHRQNAASRRLAEIPGVGPLTASAIVATVADPSLFRSGRQFAAWLGLTPRSNSSGGKFKLGRISKMGDGYIRRLLVVGATSVIKIAQREERRSPWTAKLLKAKPARLVSVALANKTARVAWAMLARDLPYAAPVA